MPAASPSIRSASFSPSQASTAAWKASPAPTVSTSGTARPATATRREAVQPIAPAAPRVTMTSRTPSASARSKKSAGAMPGHSKPRSSSLIFTTWARGSIQSSAPRQRVRSGSTLRRTFGSYEISTRSCALDERAQGRCDRLDDHGERADVDRGRGRRYLLQCIGEQLPVGAASAVEGIARNAEGIEPDQPESRRRVDPGHRRYVDALLAQRAHQALAHEAVRDRTEEGGGPAKTGQADRHVEGRATDTRLERHALGGLADGEQVHQRFSANDHHAHIRYQPATAGSAASALARLAWNWSRRGA